MTGKHRRPQRSTTRNLAATAAVLTAGALPLAAAGSAFADTAPAAQGPLSSLSLSSVPFGQGSALQGLGAAAQPVDAAVPLAGTLADAVTASVGSGDLPTGTLLGSNDSPQTQTREAAMTGRATAEAADFATRTSQAAGHLTADLPVAGLVDEVAPAMAGGPLQVAPNLLQDGTVGTLTDGFGGKAMDLASGTVDQVQPVVSQLHQRGVPTVGDVTTSLSKTDVPVFGTVGNLTSAVPVSQMVGDRSPVLGTVGAASGL
jgi:hypothetical protein